MAVAVYTSDPDTVKWLATVHNARMIAPPRSYGVNQCWDEKGPFTKLVFEPELARAPGWPDRINRNLIKACNRLKGTIARDEYYPTQSQ